MRQLGTSSHHTTPKKSKIVRIIILTIVFASTLFAVLKLLKLDDEVFKGPKTVVKLVTGGGLKSDNKRINVLMMGTGGAGHDGPNLTDTMILASIDEDGKDITLVSIPRDLWVDSVSAKINHVYAYGQENGGNGLKDAENTVSSILGIPVHYAIRLDFSGFTKAVDQVGGLDIDVENSFVDPHYPIAGKEDDLCGLTLDKEEVNGHVTDVVKSATISAIPLTQITDKNDPFTCRFETLNFEKGPNHMDGTTALKFVRTRYGTNGEGSDFARSARQQKVLLAFRQKVISAKTLTDPKTVINLAQTLGASIDTDIANDDIAAFAKLGTKVDPSTISRVVLDASRDESVLQAGEAQNYGGQYVLIPKGSWEDLGSYIQAEVFKLEQKQ